MKKTLRSPAVMTKPPKKYIAIWEAVRKIPKGKVSTYGEIATLCGLLGQARLVGYALHNLPRGTKVPWHRVINAAGKISISELDGMAELQEELLRKEGIRFSGDKVNLWRYGWPRTPERAATRGRDS
jgi:methylated-DNA-protein-cysteine methyltransferase-like protein